jgi:hypothetical protein
MRFKNYLNERDEKIYSSIKPFIKEFGIDYMHNYFIYRGVKNTPKTYTYKKTRKNRKPRFIPEELHNYLGNLSKKLWG